MKQLIKLAKEARLIHTDNESPFWAYPERLEVFANLVIEECAKVCEEKGMVKGGEVFAARIREMKK